MKYNKDYDWSEAAYRSGIEDQIWNHWSEVSLPVAMSAPAGYCWEGSLQWRDGHQIRDAVIATGKTPRAVLKQLQESNQWDWDVLSGPFITEIQL
jgi:hypothetical protein